MSDLNWFLIDCKVGSIDAFADLVSYTKYPKTRSGIWNTRAGFSGPKYPGFRVSGNPNLQSLVTPEKLEKLAFLSNPLMIFALSHAYYSHSVCFECALVRIFFKLWKAVTFLLLCLKLIWKYIFTLKNRSFYPKVWFWLINWCILMVGPLWGV